MTLRVTLEMVPFGLEEKKRTLGKMDISNVGGTPNLGKYCVEVFSNGGVLETFIIRSFKREKGAWALTKRALDRLLRKSV